MLILDTRGQVHGEGSELSLASTMAVVWNKTTKHHWVIVNLPIEQIVVSQHSSMH